MRNDELCNFLVPHHIDLVVHPVRMPIYRVDVLCSGGASKRLQQPVEGFVADDLASSDSTIPNRHVPDALMRTSGIVMFEIGFHIVSKMLFGEEDNVIEALLLNRFVPAFDKRVHIRSHDAGPDQALAEDIGGLLAVLAVVVEDPVAPSRQGSSVHGGAAECIGDSDVGGMQRDPQQVHAAGVVLDGAEYEGVHDGPEQTNRHLDEVGSDEKRCMPVDELRPGRACATVMVGGWSPMLGEHPSNRGFRNPHAAPLHLPGDAGEPRQARVIDAQDGNDLLLPQAGSPWFRVGGGISIGFPLLVALEPADQALRGNQPVKHFPDRDWDRGRQGGEGQALTDAQGETRAVELPPPWC